MGISHQLAGCLGPLALDPVAAHDVDRLWGKPQVPHHWNLGSEDRFYHRQSLAASLKFHAFRPTLTYEAARIAHGLLYRDMVAQPGHIAYDQSARFCSCYSSRMVNHYIHCGGEGIVIS